MTKNSAVRIIKKYPNRRLYDTELALYIKLEDIKELVLKRIEFQVIDVHTGKDLTHATLLQIITEHESSSKPLFSTHMLEEFIRFYNEKSHSLLNRYLEEALNVFVQQKDFLKQQWSEYESFFSSALTPFSANMTPPPKKSKRRSKLDRKRK